MQFLYKSFNGIHELQEDILPVDDDVFINIPNLNGLLMDPNSRVRRVTG